MVAHFPAFKLGLLAFRQSSKYLAEFFQKKAKENRIFREYICIPPAQLYNELEVKTKMWAMHMGKPVDIKPLSETCAIELGVKLLGELVVFLTAAGTVTFEIRRQMRCEKRRLAKEKQDMNEIFSDVQVTEMLIEEQGEYIKEMEKTLKSLGHSVSVRKPKEPFKSKLLKPVVEMKTKATQTEASKKAKPLKVVHSTKKAKGIY